MAQEFTSDWDWEADVGIEIHKSINNLIRIVFTQKLENKYIY